MSLAQDSGYVLNHLRAQYLQTVDDDQSHRIIRPFPHHFRRHDTKEFNELLTRIESPSIPVDVLEETELLRRLNERSSNTINEESEDDAEQNSDTDKEHPIHPAALQKTGFMDSIRSSIATLKFNDSKQVVAPLSDNSDSGSSSIAPQQSQSQSQTQTQTQSQTQSQTQQQLPFQMKRQPSISSKNVLSKLFRNSSSSSTIERRNSSTATKGTTGEFDEYDEDYDDDDDDEDDNENISISSTDGTIRSQGDDTNIELNETTMDNTFQDEQGILVDQNYSDVNNTSNMERRFIDDGNKFLFGNSISSGDDDLLLDSDFSEDDTDLMDSTYQIGTQIYSLSSKASSSHATPSASRSANRRHSFDKTFNKPKSRRRADSLTRNTPFSPTKATSSNMVQQQQQQQLSSSTTFAKIPLNNVVETKASNLSSLIDKKPSVEEKDVLLPDFLFVSGEKISNRNEVMDLKVYLPNEETIDLVIRKSVKVFEVIGFILMHTSLKFPELLTNPKLHTPNKWCLKLVDDDGEAYEGSFGLLDRTKLIGSFGSGEVALCPVTESEFQDNELKTPFVSTANGRSGTPSPVKKQNQNNYYKSIIPKVDNVVKDARKVTIKVFEYPYKDDGSYQSFELLVSDHINDVLLKYTKLKGIDPNDYVLKPVREEMVLDLNDDISTLDENYRLEILNKRTARILRLRRRAQFVDNTLPVINSNLTPQTLVMKNQLDDTEEAKQQQQQQQQQHQPITSSSVHRSNSKPRFSSSVPKFSSSFKSKNSSRNNFSIKATESPFQPSALNAQYLQYTVWRRLPMSFINRHERTLAIDGEYVYIMPNDEKNWYDTNFKNTTFHVSQILSCKVSRQSPANFKIVVMKASGPKRYVFEAMNSTESRAIIGKLQTLRDAYKINTQSVN